MSVLTPDSDERNGATIAATVDKFTEDNGEIRQ